VTVSSANDDSRDAWLDISAIAWALRRQSRRDAVAPLRCLDGGIAGTVQHGRDRLDVVLLGIERMDIRPDPGFDGTGFLAELLRDEVGLAGSHG